MKRMLIVAAWVCLAASTPALAQYPKPAAEPASPARTERQKAVMAKGLTPDSAFVIAASQSALAGVTFAKMAAERAASADVKRFAQRVVGEGARMSDELKPMLKAQNAPEPGQLDQRNKAVHDWLAKLSGAEFDRAYMSNMASMQAAELMVFERAATRSQNDEVKAWASKNLPVLKDQQESAMAIAKKIAG